MVQINRVHYNKAKKYIMFTAALVLLPIMQIQSLEISKWNACIPDGSSYWTTYGVSLLQCMKECSTTDYCKSVNYHRLFQECRLSMQELGSTINCAVSVVVEKRDFPLQLLTGIQLKPVIDVTQIPGCTFVKNVDERSVAVTCSQNDKLSIYTLLLDGRITNHVTVFRAIAGIGDDPFDAWMTGEHTTWGKTCVSLETCTKHYRHPIVSTWDELAIQWVRVSFKGNNREVAFLMFRGEGRDIEAWFDRSTLVNSSWPDLLTHRHFQFFSLRGDAGISRRFFVCLPYNGCPGDLIYTLVAGTDACPWETRGTYTYSDKESASGGYDLKLADGVEIVLYF